VLLELSPAIFELDEPLDAESLGLWAEALDEMTLFEVLDVAPSVQEVDVIHAAFHTFCSYFHPDLHLGRPEAERALLRRVFHRGTEAHRVLLNADERLRYQLHVQARFTDATAPEASAAIAGSAAVWAPTPSPTSEARAVGVDLALAWEHHAQSVAAKPFAARAFQLFTAGDLAQARLQLMVALAKEPPNSPLREVASALPKKNR
jgi:hypothetical protein